MADIDGRVLIRHFHMSTFPHEGHSVTYYEKSAGVLRVLCEAEKQNQAKRWSAGRSRKGSSANTERQWSISSTHFPNRHARRENPVDVGERERRVILRSRIVSSTIKLRSADHLVYTSTHLRKRPERAHATLLFMENTLKDNTAELTGCISFVYPCVRLLWGEERSYLSYGVCQELGESSHHGIPTLSRPPRLTTGSQQ
ncbi:hypothetical protein H4582DRAFT_2132988 [Lactarius indigo]|nr:hypothetical protein H4582DRAFT_2132988 [Lactarius indigo]